MGIQTTLELIQRFQDKFFKYPSLFMGKKAEITGAVEYVKLPGFDDIQVDSANLQQIIYSNTEDTVVTYSGKVWGLVDGETKEFLIEDCFKRYIYIKEHNEVISLVVDNDGDWVKVCSSPEVAESYIKTSKEHSWDYIVVPITYEV